MLRLLLIAVLVFGLPAHAADFDRSRQVVLMIYDVGLYGTELDRVMRLADTKGVYTGPTPAVRARNRAATATLMLRQRDAVLNEAIDNVTARATDPQLNELLRMASSGTPSTNPHLLDEAVRVVKSSFEDALWDQLTRTARGTGEFPCTQQQRSHCQ